MEKRERDLKEGPNVGEKWNLAPAGKLSGNLGLGEAEGEAEAGMAESKREDSRCGKSGESRRKEPLSRQAQGIASLSAPNKGMLGIGGTRHSGLGITTSTSLRPFWLSLPHGVWRRDLMVEMAALASSASDQRPLNSILANKDRRSFILPSLILPPAILSTPYYPRLPFPLPSIFTLPLPASP